ncbi:alpha-L-fucosidase C-terminal domain-containing protein [Candidatus Binatus sp.]|uniref:alpha-L-fucosidase C-terminal domain-containing protein n=1 Tax=Candidatus Binatus sp. TaxID=2811406 RepID=UPI003FA5D4AF
MYAILLDTPRDAEVCIRNLHVAAGADVRLLGIDQRLQWRNSGDDLIIHLPAPLADSPAHALRMPLPT